MHRIFEITRAHSNWRTYQKCVLAHNTLIRNTITPKLPFDRGRLVLAIDTKDQVSDQFTKGLGVEALTHLWQKLTGWSAEV